MLNLPISSFLVSIQLLMRQLVNFAHNLVVVMVAVFLFPQHLGFENLIAFPGMFLVALNMLAVIQLVGYIGARYRDLEPLLAAIMQPLFFLTPVIFRPQQLGANEYILNFNPFAHWLKLIRGPLMGEVPPVETWLIVVVMTVVSWIAALWMTAAKRRRLAYWVH
ncbi:hypothetical protein GCM10007879_29050 [Maritalea porphyrae]|uniref:ABC-2 type transporter transmembrane domain-containing protein n=2 Tax=Maritalea porphyrae TaxID=880732 RepID=A0ABQ5UTN5_9HYPH|nr:hypothetical protein GCM10007879_29050 [Maritalea porphyrae]